MARITVEDCLENMQNRFALVLIAAKRAKELMKDNEQPMISNDKENKEVVTSLREIAAGYVGADQSKFKEEVAKLHQEIKKSASEAQYIPPEAE